MMSDLDRVQIGDKRELVTVFEVFDHTLPSRKTRPTAPEYVTAEEYAAITPRDGDRDGHGAATGVQASCTSVSYSRVISLRSASTMNTRALPV